MKLHRDGDRLLQLLIFNEECLVSASHQLALITSLPFVHTARRSYRLDVLVKRSDWRLAAATPLVAGKFVKPSHLEEGEVVTRFPSARVTRPPEASAARKGARRDWRPATRGRPNKERASSASRPSETRGAVWPPPSTAGDTVKLRGPPQHLRTPSGSPEGARGRGNDPGYGNSVEGRSDPESLRAWKWGIRSQVLRRAPARCAPTDAVHRLDGGGSKAPPRRPA